MIWVLIPLLGLGAAAAGMYFWDEITDWWQKIIAPHLQRYGLQSIQKGYIELDKVVVRARRVVKKAIAVFKISKEKAMQVTTEEEIDITDLNEELRAKMKGQKAVLQMVQKS